jgi:MFS transporter, DHA1 family, inner membrane transport protein
VLRKRDRVRAIADQAGGGAGNRCPSAHPAKICAAVAFGLGGFYAPGPFAGYLFGKLVVLFGWGPASIFTIVLPAVIAASLMCLFDVRSMRSV